jgi:imidazolonepropionase-like amidohydrolase
MLGLMNLGELPQKMEEMRMLVTTHQETYSYAGNIVVVSMNKIEHLEITDLATAELIKEIINTAFENHQVSSQKKVNDFVESQPTAIKKMLQQAIEQ